MLEVALSQWELAQVLSGAGREGMAASAWLGEVGVRAASRPIEALDLTPPKRMQDLMVAHNGLMDLRRILRNVGGNLNDVARHANSTGTLAGETAQVQALVARVVLRVDAALSEVGGMLALARRAHQAARTPQHPAARRPRRPR